MQAFGCSPESFPLDVRQILEGLLEGSGHDLLEGYIRQGCLELVFSTVMVGQDLPARSGKSSRTPAAAGADAVALAVDAGQGGGRLQLQC